MTCFIRVLNSADFGGKLSLMILSKLTILDAVNKLIFIKTKKHQIGVNGHQELVSKVCSTNPGYPV